MTLICTVAIGYTSYKVFASVPGAKRSGDYVRQTLDGCNTGKPASFALGLNGRESIGSEHNCEHSQLDGNIILGTTTQHPGKVQFTTAPISGSDLLSTLFYKNSVLLGKNYICASSATTQQAISVGMASMLNPPGVFSVYCKRGYTFNVAYQASLDAITYSIRVVYDNGQEHVMAYHGVRKGNFQTTSYMKSVEFEYVYSDQWNGGTPVYSEGTGPLTWYFLSPGDSNIAPELGSLPQIRKTIMSRVYSYLATTKSAVHKLSWYEPCRSAVESMTALSMNNLENLSQLADPKGMLPPARDILNIKKHPAKGIASIHLWFSYAAKTSLKDTMDILNNYGRILEALGQSQPTLSVKYGTSFITMPVLGSTVSVRLNSKIMLYQKFRTEVETLTHKMAALGFAPGIAPSWDMVPFSFVIDWFIGFGDMLASVDYALFTANRFDVQSVTNSAKLVIPLSISQLGISGDVQGGINLTYYYRWVTNSLPLNEFHFGTGNANTHIFDGLALVIANW